MADTSDSLVAGEQLGIYLQTGVNVDDLEKGVSVVLELGIGLLASELAYCHETLIL